MTREREQMRLEIEAANAARARSARELILAKFIPLLDGIEARQQLVDAQKIWGAGNVKDPAAFEGPVWLVEEKDDRSVDQDLVVRKFYPLRDRIRHNKIDGTGAEIVLEHTGSPFSVSHGGGVPSIDYPYGRPTSASGPYRTHTILGIAVFEDEGRPMVMPYYLQGSGEKPSENKPQFDHQRTVSLISWFKPLPINVSNIKTSRDALTSQLFTFTTDSRFKHPENKRFW